MLLPVLSRFEKILRAASPRGLDWQYHPFADEDHNSIPHKTMFAGLKELYGPWREAPADVVSAGAAGLRKYRESLAEKYGYDKGLSYTSISSAGNRFMRDKRFDQAVAVFRLCTELFPDHEFAHSRLGRAFEGAGQLAETLHAYRNAYARAVQNQSPHLHVVMEDLDRMQKAHGAGRLEPLLK